MSDMNAAGTAAALFGADPARDARFVVKKRWIECGLNRFEPDWNYGPRRLRTLPARMHRSGRTRV